MSNQWEKFVDNNKYRKYRLEVRSYFEIELSYYYETDQWVLYAPLGLLSQGRLLMANNLTFEDASKRALEIIMDELLTTVYAFESLNNV